MSLYIRTPSFLLLAFFLVVAANIPGIESYSCYSCSHTKVGSVEQQSNCKDTFSSSNVSKISCSTACYKLYSAVSKVGVASTTRGCFVATKDLTTCSDGTFDDGTTTGTLNCCTSDLCNSASKHHHTLAIVYMTVSVSLMLAIATFC